ncbi:MAG: DUF542 domain-containing protein [Sphaerochaeta sp.]|jgi:regulator of cell morphogenesis and NO signaling|uniref:DUF542 domain-containing protein n=1 Tax=Sphaerochaeta sp. TaxID=1972642 RepID=UPI002FC7C613
MKNTTLAELVRRHPLATTFLNERHIDYCCGGNSMLFESIQAKGYETQAFLAELEQYLIEEEAKFKPTIPDDLYTMDVPSLITHLEVTHHRDERQLFSAIDEKITTILSVHYQHHKAELIEVFRLYSDLKKELVIHFAQEEQQVFPLMQAPVTVESLAQVEALEDDHKAAGEIIKALERATHDFSTPSDACPTYVATYALLKQLVEDIFLHIYKENSILFPIFEQGVNA